MAKRINFSAGILGPNVSVLSRLRRAKRKLDVEQGRRPAEVLDTRNHPTKPGVMQFRHHTNGWR